MASHEARPPSLLDPVVSTVIHAGSHQPGHTQRCCPISSPCSPQSVSLLLPGPISCSRSSHFDNNARPHQGIMAIPSELDAPRSTPDVEIGDATSRGSPCSGRTSPRLQARCLTKRLNRTPFQPHAGEERSEFAQPRHGGRHSKVNRRTPRMEFSRSTPEAGSFDVSPRIKSLEAER
jgi:hypothetical protein